MKARLNSSCWWVMCIMSRFARCPTQPRGVFTRRANNRPALPQALASRGQPSRNLAGRDLAAKKSKSKLSELEGQPDPRAALDAAGLLSACQGVLARLEAD